MCKILTVLFCLLFTSSFTSGIYAQKYEAENATLAGGASKIACSNCSGGNAVAQGEGNLTFTVTIPAEGFYNIYSRAASPSGDKINEFEIGGNSLDFSLKHNSQYTTLKLVSAQKLAAGQHQVKLTKSWGWIDIDYIEFERVEETGRFDLNQTLVTPNPTAEAKALYGFLLDNCLPRWSHSGVIPGENRPEQCSSKSNNEVTAYRLVNLMHPSPIASSIYLECR